MQLARALLVVGSLDAQLAVLVDDAQLRREIALELALGALDGDMVAVDVDLDTGRNGNGILPIRDMVGLPDVGEDFPAELGLARARARS